MDASGADPARLQASVLKVVSSAEAVEAELVASEQVKAADDNPFGVPLAIAGTLVPTLTRLIFVGSSMKKAA